MKNFVFSKLFISTYLCMVLIFASCQSSQDDLRMMTDEMERGVYFIGVDEQNLPAPMYDRNYLHHHWGGGMELEMDIT